MLEIFPYGLDSAAAIVHAVAAGYGAAFVCELAAAYPLNRDHVLNARVEGFNRKKRLLQDPDRILFAETLRPLPRPNQRRYCTGRAGGFGSFVCGCVISGRILRHRSSLIV